jgi:hypothetical protein
VSCQAQQITDISKLKSWEKEIVIVSIRTGANSTRVMIEWFTFLHYVEDQDRTKVVYQIQNKIYRFTRRILVLDYCSCVIKIVSLLTTYFTSPWKHVCGVALLLFASSAPDLRHNHVNIWHRIIDDVTRTSTA